MASKRFRTKSALNALAAATVRPSYNVLTNAAAVEVISAISIDSK